MMKHQLADQSWDESEEGANEENSLLRKNVTDMWSSCQGSPPRSDESENRGVI